MTLLRKEVDVGQGVPEKGRLLGDWAAGRRTLGGGD